MPLPHAKYGVNPAQYKKPPINEVVSELIKDYMNDPFISGIASTKSKEGEDIIIIWYNELDKKPDIINPYCGYKVEFKYTEGFNYQ